MNTVIAWCRFTIVVVLATSLTGSCDTEKNTTSENASTGAAEQTLFEGLTGTWQHSNGKSFERWTHESVGRYRAVVFSVNGSDTSWNEQADIYNEQGRWVFENTVQGQNDGRSIKFIESAISDTHVRFSNPAHDFPTDVNYRLVDANTLEAFIIGPGNDGKKDTIRFHYKRKM